MGNIIWARDSNARYKIGVRLTRELRLARGSRATSGRKEQIQKKRPRILGRFGISQHASDCVAHLEDREIHRYDHAANQYAQDHHDHRFHQT